jgi:hypothetical protein
MKEFRAQALRTVIRRKEQTQQALNKKLNNKSCLVFTNVLATRDRQLGNVTKD